MEQHDHLALTRVLEALDSSIEAVVTNPVSAGVASLERAAVLCRHLAFNDAPDFGKENAPAKVISDPLKPQSPSSVEVLWQIRGRLGRLKMLLDAARDFYSGLASSPSTGMDYDVQGEWMDRASGGLLQLDC